jgi:hypothetical protein
MLAWDAPITQGVFSRFHYSVAGSGCHGSGYVDAGAANSTRLLAHPKRASLRLANIFPSLQLRSYPVLSQSTASAPSPFCSRLPPQLPPLR